ncbi:MAG: hypothetical protein NTU48_08525 [Legionellales bacterium]|nr:hypothetical protein [Legionellales bacterium]
MGSKKDETTNKRVNALNSGLQLYKTTTAPPTGTKTAIKIVQTSIGSRAASVAANMNGIPATPGMVKIGAKIADKALDAKEKLDNAIEDKIHNRKPG